MNIPDTKLRASKPQDKPYRIQVGDNTYLEILPSGRKVWRMRYLSPATGRGNIYTIGSYPDISQPQARELAKQAKAAVKAGYDPVQYRKEEGERKRQQYQTEQRARTDTFEAIARAWHKHRLEVMKKWSDDHALKIMRQLEQDVFPFIGAIPIKAIKAPELMELQNRVVERGSWEAARKLSQRIGAVFSYAVVRKLADHNEADSLRGELPSSEQKHNPFLKPEQIRPFLDTVENDSASEIIKVAMLLTLHTLARTGEIRFARWEEFDLEKRLWNIPAERMKMKRPHTIPLSNQVLELLQRVRLYNPTGYLFKVYDTGKPFSENGMLQALYRMGYKGKLTMHGLRATGSTILNTAGFRGEVIEAALAHSDKDAIRAAYNHSDYLEERREMMQWWSNHIDALQAGAKVVSFRRKSN